MFSGNVSAHFILLGRIRAFFGPRKDRPQGKRERERERNGADGEGDDSDGVRALGVRAGAGEQARTRDKSGLVEREKE